jgi:hypothetical protein
MCLFGIITLLGYVFNHFLLSINCTLHQLNASESVHLLSITHIFSCSVHFCLLAVIYLSSPGRVEAGIKDTHLLLAGFRLCIVGGI